MRKLIGPILVAAVVLALPAARCFGVETERQYLSGKGKDDAVAWDFFCTAGQNANQWSTIKVPSNWELQGFGIYSYGRDQNREGWPKVQGRYKRSFTVPAAWAGKSVFLVFDGAMTDTQAMVNGQPAGPMHQGGYYRFKYDVTKLVKMGEENQLEVTVDDESANASVNNAERRGDYWNFAGIYRPVYLEAMPAVHVERVAINAKADGSFNADVVVQPSDVPLRVSGRILDLQGRQVGGGMEAMIGTGQKGPVRLTTRIANPRTWSAETPALYRLEVGVGSGGGDITHSVSKRFGFRTIEARRGDTPNPGLFVNGQRVMLKGADRHSFWPDSGRCLSEQVSRDDILLMKEMNMNAVRMSHYPPDEHFLDLCDELGMYVLDELAGWHQKYDTPTGHRLVEEMVTRDVNHPSILFWDNGNEGGWNTDLDDDFAKWDPQERAVLHPWNPFRGIDTKHYPVYSLLQQKAAGDDLLMPTEMLHGLYDGGAGASLEDYWNVLRGSKVGAGGFIWALVDESVKRTDLKGKLDSKGNQAPDGIVGPYREKEGSFYAVKQLWSPIVVTRQGDDFIVENRYSFIDAKDCTFTVEHWQLPRVGSYPPSEKRLAQRFEANTEGSIAPGGKGKLVMPVFPATTFPASFEVMALTVKDPSGRELWTYTWPEDDLKGNYSWVLSNSRSDPITTSETSETLTVAVGDLTARFSKTTGQLEGATRAGKTYALTNGPRLFQGMPIPEPQPRARGATTAPAPATAPAEAPAPKLASLEHAMAGNDLLITARYTGDLHQVTYRVRPNGWITMEYAYDVHGARDYFGVAFDYPEAQVKSMRYLGGGPYRVWKNRLAGGTLGVWEKAYNDTSTGEPTADQTGPFAYPEFKGYYAGVRWAELQTSEGPMTVLLDQGDEQGGGAPVYLQVLTPRMAPPQSALKSGVNVGSAGLAVLHAIPPIGNKFDYTSVLGPQAQRTVGQGEYRGVVSVYFGALSR